MGSEGVTRRRFVAGLGLAGAALALPFGRRRALAAAGEPVAVGLRRATFASWPVELAAAAGLFGAAGVEARLSYWDDELAAARALASGAVDAAVLTLPLFYSVHLGAGEFAGKGRPLAAYQVALVNGATLVVPTDSPVRFSRQFRDKVFGLTTRSSMQALLLQIYLQQSGLDSERETRREFGEREALARRLGAGALDALVAEEWLPAELVQAGRARVMVPMHRLWLDYPAEVIAVTRDFAAARPKALERLALATLRAARALDGGDFSGLARSHPPGSGRLAPWQAGMRDSKAGFFPFPFLSAARLTLEELKKAKAAPPDVDFKAVAEATLLTGLCREQMRAAGFAAVPQEDSREERLIGCCYTGF